MKLFDISPNTKFHKKDEVKITDTSVDCPSGIGVVVDTPGRTRNGGKYIVKYNDGHSDVTGEFDEADLKLHKAAPATGWDGRSRTISYD